MNDRERGRQAVRPDALPSGLAGRFAYSYGVRDGSTLYISGMVAIDASGNVVGVNDVSAQATAVFENIKAVVEAAGGSLDDLVATTTYMTDPGYSPAINEVRQRYLTALVKPTSTLVTVATLARPEFLVEISGIAVLG